jgi:hypothetical protein
VERNNSVLILVFRDLTPCRLVGGYQHSRGMYDPHIQLYPEGEGDVFLQNTGNHLQDYTLRAQEITVHMRSDHYIVL